MYTKIFTTLPQEAKNIRIEVFMKEQGYIPFGQIDDDEGVPHMWMKKKIQY